MKSLTLGFAAALLSVGTLAAQTTDSVERIPPIELELERELQEPYIEPMTPGEYEEPVPNDTSAIRPETDTLSPEEGDPRTDRAMYPRPAQQPQPATKPQRPNGPQG